MRKGAIASTVVLVGACCFSAHAVKTAQQLKTELQDMLPTGKKARLAWTKGGYQRGDWTGTGANVPANWDKSIYVMDSDDGVVRELTPASIFPGGTRSIDNPSITHDGSRVVFCDSKTNTFYVINWDGTGLKSFYDQGYMSRYWRDQTNNSDWVTVEDGGIRRVNIDVPTTTVLLWNKSEYGRPWYTLSRDGTRMALNCPHPTFGIATVPNGTLTTVPGEEGCFINISPDNNYQIMPQNGTHTVHTIFSSSGSVVKTVNTSSTILAGYPNPTKVTLNACNNGEMEYECTRWAETDYLTFFFYATNVNPFVECISTGKWMYIHDAQELGDCGWAGNMDFRLLNASGVVEKVSHAAPAAAILSRGGYAAYGIDGRNLSAPATRSRGIVLLRAQTAGSGVLRKAVAQ